MTDRVSRAAARTYRVGDAADAAAAILRLAARDRVALRAAARGHAASTRTIDAHFAELFGRYAAIAARRAAA